MNWFILTLLSVFIVSLANILQRVLMKDDKSNPYSYAIVFHLILGVLNLIFVAFHGFQIPTFGNIPALLISTFLWGGATIFLFKALQLLEASEVTILSSARVIITILASVLFLKESFNTQKVLGTIIILTSVLLVTKLKKGIKINKGLIYTAGTVLFSGLGIVSDSFNVQHYDVISYNMIVNFLIGFLILIFYPKTIQQWKDFIKPKFFTKMLPLGVLSMTQATLGLYALTYGGNTAQIGAIRQAAVILTVLLAVILLNERVNLVRKLVAAILVTFGVILLH